MSCTLYVVESWHPNGIYLPAKVPKTNKKCEKARKARVTLDRFWITFDVFKDGRATSKVFKKGVKLCALSDFRSLQRPIKTFRFC